MRYLLMICTDETAIGALSPQESEAMLAGCHPALSVDAQVALTLRTLAGLTTREIARAFLVSEPTMAARLGRAKTKIHHAVIPYRVPPGHLLPERTAAVLGVLYLLFNEGYSATAGEELVRRQLCEEAIRLSRLVTELMPDEPEALGLLALMLLQDARREARTAGDGVLITLEEQERGQWDPMSIEEGRQLLDRALRRKRPWPYQVQAAIAACHSEAMSFNETDWAQIALLYERLAEFVPTPVVELNRAVAVAMRDGPEAGLRLVDQLVADGSLDRYHLLQSTRGELLRRMGRRPEAAEAFRQALALAGTDVERRHLQRRLAETEA